ncbi:MAG: beta-ketoacyl-[acyl-carrier-protein] synthase family protein, partial [Spirochaetia bacterium]|nr:beta-ketoacyl-[acyl-carrier-protein] synthase family protein [Spirochaetia bacterium]
MNRRVVVTGLGVIAPNGNGLKEFEAALRAGKSGIRFQPRQEEAKFGCQVGGIPQDYDKLTKDYFTEEDLYAMNEAMIYSGMVAMDAWKDAGFDIPDPEDDNVNWDAGAIIGTGLPGVDTLSTVIPKVDAGRTRRMGSTIVEQTMASSVTAKVTGFLALGNQVTTNSSACSTGTEAIIMGYQRIRSGLADRMICGGVESSAIYVWGSFDSMKVLNVEHNHEPEKASRPMSASTAGFIPGSGGGVLLLESLESAEKRGARIYAEVLGGDVNSGGHRLGGSMTAPNATGVQNCIKLALKDADLDPARVDAINGHLTGTFSDPYEINNWSLALGRGPENFPYINSTKSL